MRIVVAGATGNTGAPLVQLLSKNKNIKEIIAITRDPSSPSSLLLSSLPRVKVTTLDQAFENNNNNNDNKIDRAFMAFANTADQFVQETDFLIRCKDAGVKYIVKISTYGAFMNSVYTKIFYARCHIGVRYFLEQGDIPYTLLEPALFFPYAVFDLEKVKREKKVETLLTENPVACIDPADVANVAATLLSLDDPSPHYSKIYRLDGPESLNVSKLEEIFSEVLQEKITRADPLTKEQLKAFFPLSEELKESAVSGIIGLQQGVFTKGEIQTDPVILSLAPPSTTFKDYIRKFYDM